MDVINAEVRARIVAAADQLFEAGGRGNFPPVDAVRRAARADMNTTSAVMKEWRRQQTAQAAPIAVAVPEVIARANEQAMALVWTQAQELANQSLREAQSAWGAERAELDQMRVELSDAFEAQASELEMARSRIEAIGHEMRETAAVAATERQALTDELARVRADLATATTRAERAEATSVELEHRVADLRTGLERAHADIDQMRAEIRRTTTESEGLRNELAAVMAKAEAADHVHQEHRKDAAKEAQRCAEKILAASQERDELVKVAGDARETAARITGQLEAIQAQNAALMEALRGKL